MGDSSDQVEVWKPSSPECNGDDGEEDGDNVDCIPSISEELAASVFLENRF